MTNDISPRFQWPEPSTFLLPQAHYLGAAFSEFMQTNRFANTLLQFKPTPRVAAPIVPMVSMLPTNSFVRVTGDLANRPRLDSVHVPTWPYDDVLPPSRVQVVVNKEGYVISDVLLKSSGYAPADHKALVLARSLQFAPASHLTLGLVMFYWHTTSKPATTTNAPATTP